MKVEEAAEVLDRHPETVREMARRRILPSKKDASGARHFDAEDIRDYADKIAGRGAYMHTRVVRRETGVSKSGICTAARAGELPAQKLEGRWVFRRDDVEKWERDRRGRIALRGAHLNFQRLLQGERVELADGLVFEGPEDAPEFAELIADATKKQELLRLEEAE